MTVLLARAVRLAGISRSAFAGGYHKNHDGRAAQKSNCCLRLATRSRWSVQWSERCVGIIAIDRVEWIIGIDFVDGVEGIVLVDAIDGIRWIAGIDSVDRVEWILGINGVDGIEGIVRTVLIDRIEDVVVALVLLREAWLR